MTYKDILAGMERFGATHRDICAHGIGIEPGQVRESVIVAPWWEPWLFPRLAEGARYLSGSEHATIKAWDIETPEVCATYIKTGIGAPVLMDALLALGVTPCRRIVFIGSVGALDADIRIGDIVVPELSICGDGASRYIAADSLARGDVYGETTRPDACLLQKALAAAARICPAQRVRWHTGRTFSVDTIAAQFAHLDEILALGCNVIEMETAAAFRAADLMSIPLVALFSVSDNTVVQKSLVCGRTEEEIAYRHTTRREAFPPLIAEVLR